MTLNYGSIYCNTQDFRLAPKKVHHSPEPLDANIHHYVNDTQYGYSLDKWKRVIELEEVYAKTKADAELIIAKLDALHKAGVAWKIEWDATGSAGMFKLDGTTASMLVLQIKKPTVSQKGNGASTVFVIEGLKFEQAG